jgi:pyruvate/2-oxoglutarate dehydrogenase complex dihydrolipoamide acyltransferase (E2) component
MSSRRRPRNEERPARENEERLTEDRGETVGDPDVLLDVPALKVEELDLQAEEIRVRVSFVAELADMVKINVGLEAEVDNFKLEVKGVEAQAQLKARLDNVRAIFSEVLSTLDRNPSLVRDMMGDLDETGDEPGQPEAPPRGFLEQGEPEDGPEDMPRTGNWESEDVEATKAAREKARDLEVDLTGLEGTGSGGRILVKDVLKAAKR